jgi:hypothetical protein
VEQFTVNIMTRMNKHLFVVRYELGTTPRNNVTDLLQLKWQTQHEDGLQLTERNKGLCGYFHPPLKSDLIIHWVPIKAMANINDKFGNREN